jgi:hypothetical protein
LSVNYDDARKSYVSFVKNYANIKQTMKE